MQKPKRVTLQTLADAAGVTKMTVSRYLREPASVSAPTGNRIAAAIDTLGYIRNRAPAMLSKASSRAIGVVIPSLSNQVFAALVQGIETVTGERRYDTLLAHTGYSPQTEEEKIATLLSYQIDGLILTETTHTDNTLKMLTQAGIPVVEAMELPARPVDMAVGLDHTAAAAAATRKLLAAGCQAPAYLAARLDSRTLLRRAGYVQAMQQAGKAEVIVETPHPSSFSVGRALMADVMARHPETDGVLCTNDDIAVGAMFWCHEHQRSIPEDIKIIGYNGLDIGQAVTPPLTSVATPRHEIGVHSATCLLDAIAGQRPASNVLDVGFCFTQGATV